MTTDGKATKRSHSDGEPFGSPEGWLAHGERLVRHSILTLGREDGVLHVAAGTDQDVALAQRLVKKHKAEAIVHLAKERAIQNELVRVFREEDLRTITWSHAENRPDQSGHRVLTTNQRMLGIASIAGLTFCLIFRPAETLIVIVAVMTAFYMISALYKAALALRAMARPCEAPVSEEDLRTLADQDLPCYTVLLPLYREANVLHDLIASLEALDYPKEKLDVKLLLEEDDTETQQAADNEVLPPYFHKLIVPGGLPKGKPRACNYGLLYAKGEYCVIFDAEDRPDADQLKKAVVVFAQNGPKTACVQAKLGYYNTGQTLLTRWFTAEYMTWFDFYLPGLNALRAPIPLGGTSNHFRTSALREIGGWDPFNVTEDADIGIRAAREGWETRVVDSTTYEEATSELGNWIRQRSRWIKGYMHTWLVHMRNPLKLQREIGLGGFVGIQVMIFGTFFAYFINPVMWALVLVWYVTRASAIEAIYPAALLYPAAIALMVGNLTFVYAAVMACLRRGYFGGVKYAFFTPFYWMLMSVAAWMALYELVVKPHYWQKTQHGRVRFSADGGRSQQRGRALSWRKPSVGSEVVDVND